MDKSPKQSSEFYDSNLKERENVEFFIDRLRYVTASLRMLGLLALLMTIVNVTTVALYTELYWRNVALMQLSVTLTVILVLIFHEFKKKLGDTLFEEISDEMQWYLVKDRKEMLKKSDKEETPPISARIQLREYVKTSDLPIIPGKFGPGVYVLINFIILAGGVTFNYFLGFMQA